jgi:7-cyano-7-deazaguanine tRNA-ribosyltransferase
MFSSKNFKHGRLGKLNFDQGFTLETPFLFPVVSLITGTTATGGGLWRYVLYSNDKNGLLRRNIPVLSQVLHFTQFISDGSPSLQKWRDKGVSRRYHEAYTDLNYTAPIFFDSGGYQLLKEQSINLHKYFPASLKQEDYEKVLALQMDFAKENPSMIATLDYPLPPNLVEEEVLERIQKSQYNAIQAALKLQSHIGNKRPFLYVAAHGRSGNELCNYIKSVTKDMLALGNVNFGLAIGSLVPLRGGNKNEKIIEIISGLKKSMNEEVYTKTPIHTFGITGNLIPFLAYLGVDSFDSTSYIFDAQKLKWINPITRKGGHIIRTVKDITCTCCVCRDREMRGIDLDEIQKMLLTRNPGGRKLPNGKFKSEYYSYIALHNLEMDFQIVKETKKAIKGDYLEDYVIEFARKFPRLKSSLGILAEKDKNLKIKLSKQNFDMPVSQLKRHGGADNSRQVSYKYTSDSFNILLQSYQPPENKKILLVLPCSQRKPYSDSRSHKIVEKRLKENHKELLSSIHKVTLSGLYGPVPQEKELQEEVLRYDFYLSPKNENQIQFIAERLCDYLRLYGHLYENLIGFATVKSYRKALEMAAKEIPSLILLPSIQERRTYSYYRKSDLRELERVLQSLIVL